MPAKSSNPRKPARDEPRRPVRDDAQKGAPGFEEKLERLEQLAVRLREGNIPLEEAVALFEEGMKLSKTLEKELARVERRVQILTREPGEAGGNGEEEDAEDAGGEPALELFPELGEDEDT
jgi:exodeoxyribonuclease VII small subunit